jgi:translation elongation factor EF-G
MNVEGVKQDLLDGKYVDHGFGGEVGFEDVLSGAAALVPALRQLASVELSQEDKSILFTMMKVAILVSAENIAKEVVDSYDV